MARPILSLIRRLGNSFYIAALLVATVCTPKVYAQAAATGAILGTVTDPSGAAIPNAQIEITNMATQEKRTLTTNAAGLYDAEGLQASGTTYSVVVTQQGFKSFQSKGVKLDAGTRVTLNARLELGDTSSQVTVEASPLAVQTESGVTGGVVSSTQISQLQLNGRNFLTLQILVPGVNPTDSAQEQGGGGLTTFNHISVNGMGEEFNQVMVDGIYNMNTGDESQLNFNPPLDSIAEVRVLTGGYSARYGLTGAGISLVETKSGTNQFHGSAYEFFRNDAMDARPFFATSISPLKQNIFGFSVGGPVWIPGRKKDQTKTFFFGNEEWRRRHSGYVFRTALPTSAILGGDFGADPTLKGGALQLDQSSQQLLAQAHPGVNCITNSTHVNPACFDQNSLAMINKFWPLPNVSSGFLNYNTTPVDVVSQRDDLWRVDHQFNEKYGLMVRYSREVVQDNSPTASPNIGWTQPGGDPGIGDNILTTSFNNMVRFNMNMTPHIINSMTFGQTSDKPRLHPVGASPPDGLTINFPYPNADPFDRTPLVSVAGGWASMGTNSEPVNASDGELTYSDDFTLVAGRHVLQAGVLYINGVKRQDADNQVMGAYSFSGSHTGSPMADFLLGLDSSFSQSNLQRRAYIHYWQIEEYFQDDWKVTPRFTLNLGLRNLYFSPDTFEGNGLSDFDPSKFDASMAPAVQPNGQFIFNAAGQPLTPAGTVANPLTGLVFRGQDGVSAGVYRVPTFNLQPRFGFAYDLSGNGKTVIRGGGSIGYNRIPLNAVLGTVSNPPFVTTSTFLNSTVTNPAAGAQALVTPRSLSIVGPPDELFKPARIMTYNVTFEREIMPNGILSAGYVNTMGRNLHEGLDLNAPVPVSAPSLSPSNPLYSGCLSPGEGIPAGGFQFDPCLNQGLVSSNYTRLLYPGWAAINAAGNGGGAGDYWGTSNYHALQVAYRYQDHGLTLTMAYTRSKVLTDVGGRGVGSFTNDSASPQNPRDAKADYGPPAWDRPNILNFSYVYDLPFLKNRTDLVGKVLGGWTISGLTTIESGLALTAGITGNTGLATRPNCVASISGPGTLNEWFNTAAFAAPAYGFFGNCGTGIIRGPAQNTWNAALYKSFQITEKVKSQIRGEFFNFANHPSFLNVSTTLGAGNFGEVTSALQPRIIELGIHFDF